jgi:hypothetical protein
MEQKDKELLIRYLCMALPYDLQVKTDEGNEPYTLLSIHPNNGIALILTGVNMDGVDIISQVKIDTIKPYLRPISSMTMEEDRTRIDLGIWKSNQYNGQVIGIFQDIAYANPLNFQSALIWLLQNHFDIFGLIPARLAIEVIEENNPYKIAK